MNHDEYIQQIKSNKYKKRYILWQDLQRAWNPQHGQHGTTQQRWLPVLHERGALASIFWICCHILFQRTTESLKEVFILPSGKLT